MVTRELPGSAWFVRHRSTPAIVQPFGRSHPLVARVTFDHPVVGDATGTRTSPGFVVAGYADGTVVRIPCGRVQANLHPVTRTIIEGALVNRGPRPVDSTVVVENGVVTAVLTDGAPVADEPGDVRIDGRGGTLLPGLIDAHVHLQGQANLQQALRYGVTTVFDMFSYPQQLTTELRAAAAEPDCADMLSCGIMASAEGGFPGAVLPPVPGWQLPALRQPDDADAFVAARSAEGSDYLKIFLDAPTAGRPSLSPEIVTALVAAAHRLGLLTVAHAPTLWAFRTAFAAGAGVITHMPLDGLLEDAEIAAIAASPTVLVPTMAMMHAMAEPTDVSGLLADERLLARLDAGVADRLAAGDLPALPPSAAEGRTYANSLANMRKFVAAGVPVCVGTDANDAPGQPAAVLEGASMHRELELLVEAGMSPAGVIEAATSASARVFGLPDRGRIDVSQRADLVLVDGDPYTDVTATRNVRHVWKAGRLTG
jgi:imidazolonepropionase-like amidohydrolase